MNKFFSFIRSIRNFFQRTKLKNKDVSIISSNCIGGVIYNNLGLEFKSPTINLFMTPKDYLKFCKNLHFYLRDNAKCVEVKIAGIDYPVALLEDIYIHAMHYSSFAEFLSSWNRRVKRINFDNICFFMSERDGCSEADVLEFDKLPYAHKIIFTAKEYKNIKSSVYNEKFIDIQSGEVRPLTDLQNRYTRKQYIDDFDYVSFINKIKA